MTRDSTEWPNAATSSDDDNTMLAVEIMPCSCAPNCDMLRPSGDG